MLIDQDKDFSVAALRKSRPVCKLSPYVRVFVCFKTTVTSVTQSGNSSHSSEKLRIRVSRNRSKLYKASTATAAVPLCSMAHAIRSLFPKTGLRSFHVPRLIRTLSCTRAMNQTDQSRNEITVPPPIPDKLQDLLFAFRASKVLFAACELGIFDLLHDSKTPQSAEDIAAKMKADVDATTRLMDTLLALELLQKTKYGESWLYTNTKMASQFLTQPSPDSVYGYIKHSNKLLCPLFGNLESAVREGSNQ